MLSKSTSDELAHDKFCRNIAVVAYVGEYMDLLALCGFAANVNIS